MDKPSLVIGGKTITPKNPKMKAWRKFLAFFDKNNDELSAMTLSEYTDEMIDLIICGFNREEVTAESLNEVLDLSEVKPLTLKMFQWLQNVFFAGLEDMPKNAETAAED